MKSKKDIKSVARDIWNGWYEAQEAGREAKLDFNPLVKVEGSGGNWDGEMFEVEFYVDDNVRGQGHLVAEEGQNFPSVLLLSGRPLMDEKSVMRVLQEAYWMVRPGG